MIKSILRSSPYQSSATTPQKLFDEINRFIKEHNGVQLHSIKCDIKGCYDQLSLHDTIQKAWYTLKVAAKDPATPGKIHKYVHVSISDGTLTMEFSSGFQLIKSQIEAFQLKP